MNDQNQNDNPANQKKSDLIDKVVADVLRRRTSSDPVADTDVIKSHPELMPELRKRLDRLQKIQLAQKLASPPTADPQFHEIFPEDVSAAVDGVRIRCPECFATISLSADHTLVDIVCEECGNRFSIADSAQDDCETSLSDSRLGRFELVNRIGIGGFGAVWQAWDSKLERTVAIKIPRKGQLSAEDQNKFLREARAVAQLCHPGIVPIHEIGREGDTVYIVSQLVTGVSLSEWIREYQPTVQESVAICISIAEAIHHAHEQGVVHRDLKPQNIMVDDAGKPHVMDFGLARRDAGEITMTLDGQILGTPAYMSPEQAAGRAHTADGRSDIYSLGVVLFQLLTGELPFRGNTRMIIQQVIEDEAPSPRKLNSVVPKDLETICLKCLDKAPEKRYLTAEAVSADLERFARNEPIHARPVSQIGRSVRWCQRNPTIAKLATAVTLSLVLLAAVSTTAAIVFRHQNKISNDLRLKAGISAANEKLERENLEKIVEFVEEVLSSPDPRKEGIDVTVAEKLFDGEKRSQTDLLEQPFVRARFLSMIGKGFLNLGLPRDAIRVLETARGLFEQNRGLYHAQTLSTVVDLAEAHKEAGQYAKALELIGPTFELMKVHVGPNDRRTLICMKELADILDCNGKHEKALQIYEEALDLMEKNLEPDDQLIWQTKNDRAVVTHHFHGATTALPLYEEVYEHQRSVLPSNHVDLLNAMHQLACARSEFAGEEKKKLIQRRKQIEQQSTNPGESEIQRLEADENQAIRELYSETIHLFQTAVDGFKEELTPDHQYTLKASHHFSLALYESGDVEKSLLLLEDTLKRSRTSFGNEHPQKWKTFYRLARYYNGAKRYESLESLLLDEHDRLASRKTGLDRNDLKHLGIIAHKLINLYRAWNKPDQVRKWGQVFDEYRKRYDTLRQPATESP